MFSTMFVEVGRLRVTTIWLLVTLARLRATVVNLQLPVNFYWVLTYTTALVHTKNNWQDIEKKEDVRPATYQLVSSW